MPGTAHSIVQKVPYRVSLCIIFFRPNAMSTFGMWAKFAAPKCVARTAHIIDLSWIRPLTFVRAPSTSASALRLCYVLVQATRLFMTPITTAKLQGALLQLEAKNVFALVVSAMDTLISTFTNQSDLLSHVSHRSRHEGQSLLLHTTFYILASTANQALLCHLAPNPSIVDNDRLKP